MFNVSERQIQIEERELQTMETEQLTKWTLEVTKDGIGLKMKGGYLCKEDALSLASALTRSVDLFKQLALGASEPIMTLADRQFQARCDGIPGLIIKKKWIPSRKKKKRG